MAHAWIVRPFLPGDPKDYSDEFLKNEYIATGPNSLPRLNGYTRDNMKKLLLDKKIVSDVFLAGVFSAVANNFVNVMDAMDIGLLISSELIHVFEIQSDYSYTHNHAGRTNFICHRRNVRFLKAISRDALSLSLRSSMKSNRQVSDITKHYNEVYKLAYDSDPVEEVHAAADSISVSYPLRPNCEIKFSVPSDITRTEAERLSDYIKTLFFKED